METPVFTDTYQMCLDLYQAINKSLFGGAFETDIWMIIKGVAVSLVLLKWMNDFYKPVIKDGKHINPLPSIFEGLFYIIIIAGSSQIVMGAETLFGEIERAIAAKINLPTSDFKLYDSPETGFVGSAVGSVLYEIIKYIVMAFIIVIDIMYFISRFLGILAWQILFPLTMTLAILSDKFKENFVTQLKVFAAIYLSGAMYLLAIFISNKAFMYFGIMMPGMSFVVLLIVLFAKKQMYAKIDHWLERIFS